MTSIDLCYETHGDSLALPYASALWEALIPHWPDLNQGLSPIGVLPLKGAQQDHRLWLARRTKLVLRVPQNWQTEGSRLIGKSLMVGDAPLTLGSITPRPLVAAPSLHAQHVIGPLDELAFMDWAQNQLAPWGIDGQLLCGRLSASTEPDTGVRSLVVHHLRADHSLLLQQVGMGEQAHLGYGLFVPYKTIPNIN